MMTPSFARCLLFCFLVLSFGLGACHKDKLTTVNGIVVDKHTGLPIDNALVEFWISHKDTPAPNNYELRDTYTDENGKFTFQSEDPLSVHWVVKDGYLPKGLGTDVVVIEQGKTNDVIINMIPKDGILKLNFEDNNAKYDTIYVSIYSALQEAELGLSHGVILGYPFFVQGLFPQSETINLASEETAHIYWSSYPVATSHIQLSPNHDSVFVVRNDTTNFKISF